MYIEEIILEGFKSYPKRTVISGWYKGFNVITGENGSGKSNILDAICFLLGMEGTSMMRATCLQDLIYKKGQAGIDKAVVTIVFKNEIKEKLKHLRYDQCEKLIITRQISVTGKSKYIINGVTVTKNKIGLIFEIAHLNVNNPHFIVMQGKIIKILSMKPKEIANLIGETAGTKMYDLHRGLAEKTIGKKTKIIEEAQKILENIVIPKLDKLREERKLLNEFKNLERELLIQKRLKIDLEIKNKKMDIKDFNSKKINFEEKSKNFKFEIGELNKTKDILNNNIKELKDSINKIKNSLADVDGLKKEIIIIKGKIEGFKRQLKDMKRNENKAINDQNEQKDFDLEIKNQIRLQKSLEKKIEAQKDALKLKKDYYDDICMGRDSEGYTKMANSIRNRLEKFIKEKEALSIKIQSMVENNKRLEDQKINWIAKLDKFNNDANQLKQVLINSKAEIPLEYLNMEPFQLEKKIITKKIEIQKVENYIKNIENLIPFTKLNFNNLGIQTNQIIGYLIDLVFIKKEFKPFTKSIEIVGGGRWKNLIVETEEIAVKLFKMNLFKERITIFPLNRIINRKISDSLKRKIELIKGAYFLTDAIEFNPRILPVINQIFGMIILCDSSEIAKKIAYEKGINLRAITLDGDFYDPAGTISGGESKRYSGNLISIGSGELLKKFQEVNQEKLKIEMLLKEIQDLEINFKKLKLIKEKEIKLNELKFLISDGIEAKLLKDYKLKLNEYEIATNDLSNINSLIEKEKSNLLRYEKENFKLSDKDEKILNLKNEIKFMNSEISDLIEKKKKSVLKEQEIIDAKSNKELIIENFKNIMKDNENLKDEIKKQEEILEGKENELENLMILNENYQKEILEKELNLQNFDLKYSKIELDILKLVNLNNEIVIKNQEIEKKISSIEKEIEELISKKEIEMLNGDFYYEKLSELSYDESKYYQLKKYISENYLVKKKLIDGGNVILETLDNVERLGSELKDQISMIDLDRSKIVATCEKLNEYKREILKKTFEQVNENFGLILSDLLPDSFSELKSLNDSFTEVEIRVKIGHKWKENLNELSGGQRSLVALSLLLALLKIKPAPFYILDEIDAALDSSHTQNIGKLFHSRFSNSQFIVISLKKGFYENATSLFETKLINGSSKIILKKSQHL